jgi:hypothetical protein
MSSRDSPEEKAKIYVEAKNRRPEAGRRQGRQEATTTVDLKLSMKD